MTRVLIVGISTRAMAQSAVRAGYDVVSLDFFGDSDQPASAEVYSLVRDFHKEPTLTTLARCAHFLEQNVDAVLVESGLENEPALMRLGTGRECLFNSPSAVQGVRDLEKVRKVLTGSNVHIPEVIKSGQPLPREGYWLIKDLRHSGGMGVNGWDGKRKIGRHYIIERFVQGQLASACFVANGKKARLLGLTMQFAGVPELHAKPYAWCGNGAPLINREMEADMLQAADALTNAFGLVGINGIDFIIHDNGAYLVEVNPRIPASIDLFERLMGLNAFTLHIQGCRGELPQIPDRSRIEGVWGKGILYARNPVKVGDTSGWANRRIADIPHSDEEIPEGAPICTVMAHANDLDTCWEKILQNARHLYGELTGK